MVVPQQHDLVVLHKVDIVSVSCGYGETGSCSKVAVGDVHAHGERLVVVRDEVMQ